MMNKRLIFINTEGFKKHHGVNEYCFLLGTKRTFKLLGQCSLICTIKVKMKTLSLDWILTNRWGSGKILNTDRLGQESIILQNTVFHENSLSASEQ